MTEYEIKLTKTQIGNLIEFFEISFIDMIRDVDEIDNLYYLVDMCETYTKLKKAKESIKDDKD